MKKKKDEIRKEDKMKEKTFRKKEIKNEKQEIRNEVKIWLWINK